MTIRGRGLSLLAALAMVTVLLFGWASAASAQQDYTPPPPTDGAIQGNNQQQAPLARTGSNSTIPTAEIGVLLLVAGGFFVIVARKRAQHASATVHA